MGDVSQLELLGRFALAAALGAIIGIERESRNHAAGIRTCALASLGACVFTAIGAHGFSTADAAVDPTRVAAQVVTGIGFSRLLLMIETMIQSTSNPIAPTMILRLRVQGRFLRTG